jgi:hypothetical protein
MNDTGDSSTTEVNQISASVSDTESVPNISESPVRAVAAAELINGAEMYAEACAKYGPDDPADDSCAKEKSAEVELRT